ncbi:MAG TPA: sugar ABC transporter substrate-binding protein [Solirubrobacter sp.]|nr:sugar ABC transporter substrate-binding protein [Solirubrobacter sp.]
MQQRDASAFDAPLSRRRFLTRAGGVAASGLAAGPLLAACGGGGGGGGSAAAGKSTINYMVVSGSPFSEVVQKMIAPVFTEQTGIKVNIVELPYEQAFPKGVLEARNKSGAYDVIQINRPNLAGFVGPKYLMPLDEYVSGDLVADLFPAHRDFVTFDGKAYAMPHSNDVRALYYRTDLFQKAGLQAPQNWQELQAHAKQLTQGDVYGLLLTGSPKGPGVWTLADFIHQNGGEILDADGQPKVDSPEAIEALEFFVGLLRTDKVLPPGTANYIWADTRTLFPQGKGSMVVEFNDIIPLLDDPSNSVVAGKYDLALIPGNVKKATGNAGWLVGIPVGCKHPAEAGKLIDFLLSTQAQTEMCVQSGTLSGRKSVVDALIANGQSGRPKGDPKGKERWEFYKQVVATTYELPRSPHEPAIETILGKALSGALSGQTPPADAMKTAAKAIAQL